MHKQKTVTANTAGEKIDFLITVGDGYWQVGQLTLNNGKAMILIYMGKKIIGYLCTKAERLVAVPIGMEESPGNTGYHAC